MLKMGANTLLERLYTHYRVQGLIGFAQLVSFLSISTIISLILIFLSLILKISTLCCMVVYSSVQGMPSFQLVSFLIEVRNAIILTSCNTILYKECLFWTSLFLMPKNNRLHSLNRNLILPDFKQTVP